MSDSIILIVAGITFYMMFIHPARGIIVARRRKERASAKEAETRLYVLEAKIKEAELRKLEAEAKLMESKTISKGVSPDQTLTPESKKEKGVERRTH